ncbi:MAG: hypothetical protein OXT70_03380 [Chloroflexota bacterium]|nr:hypothetical protein [Chloroflexota bacterium]
MEWLSSSIEWAWQNVELLALVMSWLAGAWGWLTMRRRHDELLRKMDEMIGKPVEVQRQIVLESYERIGLSDSLSGELRKGRPEGDQS